MAECVSPRWKQAFTLTEMLVTIAIMAAILGLLLPVLKGARMRAKRHKAEREVKEIASAWLNYRLEYKRWPAVSVTTMEEDGVTILRGSPLYPWASGG